jgi:predicted phage terminase large subunit-like protein
VLIPILPPLEELAAMPPEQRHDIVRSLARILDDIRLPQQYVPFTPTPKQQTFLLADSREAFFGGAAGPGKSVALLMSALQYVDVPGYAALILRKTYPELAMPGALMSMARSWLTGTDARWNGETHTWTFPSKATLTFGYIQNAGDEGRYRGGEFSFVGFDELTAFTEEQYTFLFGRQRQSDNPHLGAAADGLRLRDVPLRMRGASNPGGRGHEWVKRRFVNPRTRQPGAVFIPARISDNPHIDVTDYMQSLGLVLGVERDRLMDGDWDIEESGELFNMSLVDLVDDWPEPSMSLRVWDMAATEEPRAGATNTDPDWTVGTRLDRDARGYVTITDVRRARVSPGKAKKMIIDAAISDGRRVPIVILEEPGASGKYVTHNVALDLAGWTVRGIRETGDKITRARPAAAALENRTLRINRYLPNLDEVIYELKRFGTNAAHDDIVDTISTGYAQITERPVFTGPAITLPKGSLPVAMAETLHRRSGG